MQVDFSTRNSHTSDETTIRCRIQGKTLDLIGEASVSGGDDKAFEKTALEALYKATGQVLGNEKPFWEAVKIVERFTAELEKDAGELIDLGGNAKQPHVLIAQQHAVLILGRLLQKLK